MKNESVLVLFFKKEQLARGVGGAAARKRESSASFRKNKQKCSFL